MRQYNVAVVGATGAVGSEMIKTLSQRDFPVKELRPLASSRSAGRSIEFKGEEITVSELKKGSFEGIDIALFSAGGGVSKEFAPVAAKAGAVVIDNSSAFRMEPDIPLVVPEVNPEALKARPGIIANPNCSTIQMVVVLKPLHDAAGIKRVVVSTYQAVSGTGWKAMEELRIQSEAVLKGEKVVKEVYPHQIAFNILPHIDVFLENGYTKEEMKMVNETRKIMGDNSIAVTATTARVPVFLSHSESVNVEFYKPLSPAQAREILSNAPGVKVIDDPSRNLYPLSIDAAGQDETFVGRIRKDESVAHGLNLWVVADNLRKGAALNAVQIAEEMIKRGLI
ncbi:MAG: aspartate-semialdehyde dehydrogenase [bacterium]|nr:aspartate-semialdehyde dehydrogenase [bacterium]